jgi:hypothetical protein
MICFQDLFMESRGKPILYQGKILVMMDLFPTDGCTRFRFVFESAHGEWRQGACLCIKGKFSVNRQKIPDAMEVWQDTAPQAFEFQVSRGVLEIEIRNVWDVGDGVMHSWHNGGAMLVEEVPGGRCYRCNDGFPDDDLDDVVFRIERIR